MKKWNEFMSEWITCIIIILIIIATITSNNLVSGTILKYSSPSLSLLFSATLTFGKAGWKE